MVCDVLHHRRTGIDHHHLPAKRLRQAELLEKIRRVDSARSPVVDHGGSAKHHFLECIRVGQVGLRCARVDHDAHARTADKAAAFCSDFPRFLELIHDPRGRDDDVCRIAGFDSFSHLGPGRKFDSDPGAARTPKILGNLCHAALYGAGAQHLQRCLGRISIGSHVFSQYLHCVSGKTRTDRGAG